MVPLLRSHNHNAFEIFCYAQVPSPDEITAKLKVHVDTWRNPVNLSDEQLAEIIRHDQIDILVDLAGHTPGNRLLVFARQPAPIQVFYLAYCTTTGLETIEHRITDPYLDPTDQHDDDYSEKSIRLNSSYWCYQPPLELAEAKPRSGPITFGCLNSFCKVTPNALKRWSDLLQAVPNSHLILHALEGSHRQRTLDIFARTGIDPSRLSFVGALPLREYFQLYHHIDIALDTFPYNGATTTCDALWMGVPVISLRGQTAVGRAGVSILSNINLPDLIASSHEQYTQIAVALSADRFHLAELRATLRQRMKSSPLMDAFHFTHSMEDAYQALWHYHCAK
jgi:protein O-GlcNAc transferase